MSKNRENVVWQSKDKTWNIGFFTVIPGDVSDPEYDDEWDVNYDYHSFGWASSGHPSEESARNSWRGANPGSHWVLDYNRSNAKDCKHYDEMMKCYAK